MGTEGSSVGKRLIARGPNTTGDKPDVDGTIEEERADGMIAVREEGQEGRTIVNPHGGWVVLAILSLAVTAWVYWPHDNNA